MGKEIKIAHEGADTAGRLAPRTLREPVLIPVYPFVIEKSNLELLGFPGTIELMITAGIDVGTKTTKVVIASDNQVLGKTLLLTGFDQQDTAERALAFALAQAHCSEDDLARITATGAGRAAIRFASANITPVSADARGIALLCPSARTVLDIGAEEALAIRCANGQVENFAINEKCAAGAGIFIETMARTLEVELNAIGELSRQSTADIAMNAQCTVFAESEVISLIHARTPRADIARAVHNAIASRAISMVRRVGIEPELALIGGIALNIGFVEALERALGERVVIVDDPEFVGAIGAALMGQQQR